MTTEQDVLNYWSADTREQAEHHCYKYTGCGAWIEFLDWGIKLGSIVEGCDFGTMIYVLRYADNFGHTDIGDRINAIEKEADAIWTWCNVLKDINGRRHCNGKTDAERGLDCPDVENDYDYETDGRSS